MNAEREIQRENSRKLRALGIIKYKLDTKTSTYDFDERVFNKIPFSKEYTTYDDYKKDLDKVVKTSIKSEPIHDNLFNKLVKTDKKVNDWLKSLS